MTQALRPGDLTSEQARELIPVYARIVNGDYADRLPNDLTSYVRLQLPQLKLDILAELGLSQHPRADEVWDVALMLAPGDVLRPTTRWHAVHSQQALHETMRMIGGLLT